MLYFGGKEYYSKRPPQPILQLTKYLLNNERRYLVRYVFNYENTLDKIK